MRECVLEVSEKGVGLCGHTRRPATLPATGTRFIGMEIGFRPKAKWGPTGVPGRRLAGQRGEPATGGPRGIRGLEDGERGVRGGKLVDVQPVVLQCAIARAHARPILGARTSADPPISAAAAYRQSPPPAPRRPARPKSARSCTKFCGRPAPTFPLSKQRNRGAAVSAMKRSGFFERKQKPTETGNTRAFFRDEPCGECFVPHAQRARRAFGASADRILRNEYFGRELCIADHKMEHYEK